MSTISDPIGVVGKLNAGVLLTATPEYTQIRKARRPGAGRAESRPAQFTMRPEYRYIDGTRVLAAALGRFGVIGVQQWKQ
jgi:hypothetical protein